MEGRTPALSAIGYMSSPPTLPARRDNPGWIVEHSKHIELSKNPKVGQVVLIGDDTFAGLPNYPHIWSKHLAPYRALNYGLYGDQTQHVLWRVQNGLIPVSAEIIVLYVGSINLGSHKSQDIAKGIGCIAMVCREKKLDVKIIICGLLPTYNSYSTHYGKCKNAIRKTRNVNKYLKLFCKKGHVSDCHYLKPEKDWLLPDGTLDTAYYLNGLSEKGNEKFTKSIVSIIEIVKVGIKIEMSSDSDISVEEEPCLPSQQKSTSYNISILRNSAKKRNSIAPDKHVERSRSRRKSSSYLENDFHSSFETKRPISPIRTHSRHKYRSQYSRTSMHKRQHSSSRKNGSKSRSRSLSSGNSESSRSISPVFTVRRGPDGRISKSRSVSPTISERCEGTRHKSHSSSFDDTEGQRRRSITTPAAIARSRSRSRYRSRSRSRFRSRSRSRHRSRSRSASKDNERERWIQRANSRFSPVITSETKALDSFDLKSTRNSVSSVYENHVDKQEGTSTSPLLDSESKESQSTMKMYGLFLKELEEINTKESNSSALPSTNGTVL